MTEQQPPRRRSGNDFSRLHGVDEASDVPIVHESQSDPEGKRALFSAPQATPGEQRAAAPGAVVVECGGCSRRSVLTPAQALMYAVPSIHLPYLKQGHGSWMRCPACRRRTWVSVQIQL